MGVSIGGLLIALIFIAPFVLCLWYPPETLPPDYGPLHPIILLVEYGGFAGCVASFCFGKNYILNANFDIWFLLMILFLTVNIFLWFRYYNEGQDVLLLFEPFLFIPIPMQIFSSLSVIMATVWCKSPFLGVFAVIYTVATCINGWHNYGQVK
ncbi:MAG: hypothetical protein RR902_03395 [Oscillospiraceae bacterium]